TPPASPSRCCSKRRRDTPGYRLYSVPADPPLDSKNCNSSRTSHCTTRTHCHAYHTSQTDSAVSVPPDVLILLNYLYNTTPLHQGLPQPSLSFLLDRHIPTPLLSASDRSCPSLSIIAHRILPPLPNSPDPRANYRP